MAIHPTVRTINFWLPMDEATIEGGCMHHVRGTPRGPIVPHTYLDPNDRQTALVAPDQNYWPLNGTPLPCPRGSCMIHHSYMLHYAGPNTTDRPRRGYILLFKCPPEILERPGDSPERVMRVSYLTP